ncbi:MAG TPA: acyl-CoA dehydrogenase family protein [Acidimicrobiales bacterium]|nr:acyl-CoA dehydrogenase family protein [Acidimicrobiales bacterium]
MEITLSNDQEFFRDTTRKFLATECPISTVRALEGNEAGFDASYWRQGADLGWCSLLVPEAYGGGTISGRGVVDLTIVADAFGRHVAPGPLLPTNVVAAAIARSGTDAQRDEYLAPIVAGETTAAWCLTVTAAVDGDDYVVSGVASPVEAGAEAGVLLVTAGTDSGLAQFLVPPDAPGVTITPLRSLDLVKRFARVEFSDVRVPGAAAVGTIGHAHDDVDRQLQLALVMQTTEMVAAAETAFDFTVEWAFDRYSFGRPLASYQELKHRFADMKMWLEASHALATALAREVQDDASRASETASAAKAYIGEYLAELVQDCVQMHGGIGLTRDHDLHLYLRRVTVGRSTYGLPADHRQRVMALQAG